MGFEPTIRLTTDTRFRVERLQPTQPPLPAIASSLFYHFYIVMINPKNIFITLQSIMDKKVIGPLTLFQYILIMMTSSIVYSSYLYFGLNQTFWIIASIAIALALGLLILDYTKSH